MGPEILILIAVFALMMWMMSRGAKKQRRAAAELRAGLETGQQVMTASGFFGTIVDIDGDVITLESTPGVETLWKRDAISGVTAPPFAVEETDDEDDSAELGEFSVPDDASSLIAGDHSSDDSSDQPSDGATRPGRIDGADTPDDSGRPA